MTATEVAADVLAPLAIDLPAVERGAVLPRGFVAGASTCGIKQSGRPDLAIVATSGGPASVAGVFTTNTFAAAPVRLSQRNLGTTHAGVARAVVSTSGSANAATGAAGDADQQRIGEAVAGALGFAGQPEHVLHLSTGIIGTRLPVDRVVAGIATLASQLSSTDDALLAAAEALRTTDSRTKVSTTSITLSSGDIIVSGIAKGVGMIHPRMATMLSVILTDAAVEPATLHAILRGAAARTWNQLSVDGDTSTNDTVFLVASGASGVQVPRETESDARDMHSFAKAVEAVARDLARQQAADGEGASTLITCQVSGAIDDAEARAIARVVASSSLVKAAIHGRDPNWGRIVGAAGNARLADAALLEAAGIDAVSATQRAGRAATVAPDRLRVSIAGHLVFDGRNSGPIGFDRSAARAAMEASEVVIRLDLGLGDGIGEAFGCDLTEQYVIENSEYTT
jgi:glutamate N-acetyltransferase/amino-acid N-acetyltransferase